MDHFLKPVDELSTLIEEKAQILYKKLFDLPVRALNLPEMPLNYYLGRHHDRKFFSVQTSAELLYRSIKLKGKPLNELVIMEYGAGMGSLFLLAKMIGCKTLIYNDILPDMAVAAELISKYLEIPVDLFIAGDHNYTIEVLRERGIQCDIILSRNVVEHIYDLDDFYGSMAASQPDALIYFSTTANYHNPAMLWYHKKLHRTSEQQYFQKRKDKIVKAIPGIAPQVADKLALATRGLAMNDLEEAINNFERHERLPDPAIHYTNTCDPDDGVWMEHIIPVAEYKKNCRTAWLPSYHTACLLGYPLFQRH
jgi:2-polyprenyl-3-methyl-5-hydroxy-6-metoxy-1,4-benzoquinol methylase